MHTKANRWFVTAVMSAACLLSSACRTATRTSADVPQTKALSATTKPDTAAVALPGSKVQLNVPYASDGVSEHQLDIYAPAHASHAPIVIFVHGGEWTKGDKREVSYKPALLNAHGYILVSINYRLSGTATHPAQVNDVATAVAWTRKHAAEFGGNGNRLFLMGHSAGCHITSFVGLDPRPLATVGMRPADLAGVISWSGGAFNLPEKVAEGGMYAKYIRLNFTPDPAAWRDASPMLHIGDAKPIPPFLFISAGNGNASSVRASQNMASLIRKAGGQADAVTLLGKTHATADHDVGMPGDTTADVLLKFLDGHRAQ